MVDLRSDTVTQPTDGMRAAMAAAVVGDDGFDEDPTAQALQRDVATLFGRQAALFMPSCTMANLAGLMALLNRGDELICATTAELVTHAHGALAAIGGISARTGQAVNGLLDARTVTSLLGRSEFYTNPTAAIAVEQTANRVGGLVYPLDELIALHGVATAAGIPLICDGARIWNAHTATGVPLTQYGRLFNVISVSLAKGLGAPMGGLVIGSTDVVQRARKIRKQLGGAMRQAGIMAAAARYALEHHLPRLHDDHRRAAVLAAALTPYGVADPAQVHTNMLVLELRGTTWKAGEFVAAAATQGVLCCALSADQVRLVTHLNVTDDLLGQAIDVIVGLLRHREPGRPFRRGRPHQHRVFPEPARSLHAGSS
ncbi:GntG family PLP-dependent aldolase [Dactylosporangium sp. NPDC051485]|uniref:threonine aldolase family protein n=1 Tax=Dactylosporangium sp. NPDC051485 TaxID=3154846 RepID=UPI00342A1B37